MNDLILDKDGDILIENGDFKVGDATLQHQKLIIYSSPGHWKFAPTTGVGIEKYYLNENFAKLISEVRKQMVIDGMKVESVSLSNTGNILVKADYQ
ncbi:hypothetical protein AD998_01715 [bacterium 336/3]|nr:hypothetical protein AD998_01715 [bacterium 336/3]